MNINEFRKNGQFTTEVCKIFNAYDVLMKEIKGENGMFMSISFIKQHPEYANLDSVVKTNFEYIVKKLESLTAND